jgi:ribosomal protein S18 acetylase RimI-like enzyme
MEIIEAQPQHFLEIEALIQKVWLPTYTHYANYQQIVYMLNEMYNVTSLLQQSVQGHVFYVALDKDKVIGFVSFYKHKDGVKIPKLYVDSDTRQKGVGRLLLKFVEEFSKDNQLKFMELNVNRYNKALYFYRRYGFYIQSSIDAPLKEFWLNDYLLRLDL